MSYFKSGADIWQLLYPVFQLETFDALACEALIPAEDWSKSEIMAEADIRDLARKLHISPAIVAGRWQRETGSYRKFAKLLGRDQVRCQFDA